MLRNNLALPLVSPNCKSFPCGTVKLRYTRIPPGATGRFIVLDCNTVPAEFLNSIVLFPETYG